VPLLPIAEAAFLNLLAVVNPSFVAFLYHAERDVGQQRRDDPTLWRASFRAEELIFRKDSGLLCA
jgi:hypothetical protein